MALYKRDGVWWLDIRHQGKRVRKSTGTEIREDALRLHDQLKHELWQTVKIKSLPNRTWMDAVLRWVDESSHKRSLETDKYHLAWLDSFLRSKKLIDIDRDLIEFIAKKKEAEHVSLTTVNRVLELIRAILNRAHKEWGWLDKTPIIRMRKIENKRIRWLTKEEANLLLKELPSHLEAMASFTLATGLRESNVTRLKWSEINLDKKHALIHADESKSKRPIPVPLNKQAISILKVQQGRNPTYVFTYNGNPVTRCNNHAWQKALVRAGINDFRWHDLRHTWASWHVQNGTPLHELQQLGGWSNYEMVLRYAHLSSAHLRAAAERV
ncbi:site-specific integrase [Legionella pneumophila serogroup 1]|uniref:Site-specific tyrosine recombinase XerC n=1 Tax=Fluoribacter dumoffii TaxID=463 RepID=A0A377GB90_9GAMM|nr:MULTISPECIES: site-specific integrase [Legionellaceae]KTC90382.1 Phage integrase [Fluoribacter dumoffii NY 23]MDW8866379.1 site-specific integrase [Legionella pneumophila]MDW9173198.1 site-specific integrase [Legionella pneumophila]SNV18130.1 Prophage integrase [Legionella pneumophila]STO22014.1 site-specific tyrosine recombinase XerC [Fluoribacter dumoffii]